MLSFGEVLAKNLTRFCFQNPQIVVVGGLSMATGEILVVKVLSANAQKLTDLANRIWLVCFTIPLIAFLYLNLVNNFSLKYFSPVSKFEYLV